MSYSHDSSHCHSPENQLAAGRPPNLCQPDRGSSLHFCVSCIFLFYSRLHS